MSGKKKVSGSSAVELSKAHISAINRQRRVVVNYDTQCNIPPLTSPGVTPKQCAEFELSFIDEDVHSIDSVYWNFTHGVVVYPSKIQPPLPVGQYEKWIEEGTDLLRVYLDESHKRGLETFVSWRMNAWGGPAQWNPPAVRGGPSDEPPPGRDPLH